MKIVKSVLFYGALALTLFVIAYMVLAIAGFLAVG